MLPNFDSEEEENNAVQEEREIAMPPQQDAIPDDNNAQENDEGSVASTVDENDNIAPDGEEENEDAQPIQNQNEPARGTMFINKAWYCIKGLAINYCYLILMNIVQFSLKVLDNKRSEKAAARIPFHRKRKVNGPDIGYGRTA